jgi:hypothetical protein
MDGTLCMTGARDERHTAAANSRGQQATGGEFDAQRATPRQPTAGSTSTGDPASTGHTRAGAAAKRAAETGYARRPRQRERGQYRGEAAQREDVGTTGGTLATVQLSQAVALAVGVVHAESEAAHERSLLLAPAAALDRAQEAVDLRGHPGAPRATALHELAHAGRADAHALGGLRAREALQVAEAGSLLLSLIEALAQGLEGVTQLQAIVKRARDVGFHATLEFDGVIQ